MNNPGQYVPTDSALHNSDPRAKIIGIMILSIIILKVVYIELFVINIAAVVICLYARIPIMFLFRNLRPVLPFFIFLFVIYIFITPGRPIPPFPIGPLAISYEGLAFGILQIWRFSLLVLVAAILTMTTTPSEITLGLEYLLRPLKILKISSHNVAMMVSLALRFLPTLLEEMNLIRQAQLARGANFNSHKPFGSIRSIVYLAMPLSISVFRRSNELVDAMEARGYQQGSRTYLKELKMTSSDYIIIFVFMLLLAAVLIVHY